MCNVSDFPGVFSVGFPDFFCGVVVAEDLFLLLAFLDLAFLIAFAIFRIFFFSDFLAFFRDLRDEFFLLSGLD